MKTILLQKWVVLLLLLITFGHAFGQKEGRLTYTRKMDMHKLIPSSEEKLKALIPQFKEDQIQVLFNDEYAKIVENQIKEDIEIEDHKIIVETAGDETAKYVDRKQNKSLHLVRFENDLFGTYMKREREIEPVDETKVINGYNCRKAIGEVKVMARTEIEDNGKSSAQDDVIVKEIVYWYSEKLPAGISPLGPTNLSGGVVSIETESMTYTLKELEKLNIKVEEIRPPKNFKEISEEEYLDLQHQLANQKKQHIMKTNK